MFEIASARDWRLRKEIDGARKDRLLFTPYGEIVAQITDRARLGEWKIQRANNCTAFERIVITMHLPEGLVDLFHNGAGGYRAQYYFGVKQGECANRLLIDSLITALPDLLKQSSFKRRFPWDLAETALRHTKTKAWIWQGHWLRLKRRTERNLQVSAWARIATNEVPRKKNIPIWTQLTPAHETRLQIKGPFLSDGFELQRSSDKDRSLELHRWGFT